MPDCAMCWNEWPTLTETPFPELAGIQVCRNCSRSMKQMAAFCRNHGLNIIPQVGANSIGITEEGFKQTFEQAATAVGGDEPPKSPAAKTAKAKA